jgi:hypothetical protein
MGVMGEGLLQCLIDQYLTRGVVYVIISSDDIGDTKANVIGNYS